MPNQNSKSISQYSEVSNSPHIILYVHIIIFDPIKLCYSKMPEDYAIQRESPGFYTAAITNPKSVTILLATKS